MVAYGRSLRAPVKRVMFLVAAALVSAWLITVADLPGKVAGLLEPLMGNQTLLLIAIMVLCMIVAPRWT
jgi:TRAP-type transport system large permease protein